MGRAMKESHAHLNISAREWGAMLADLRAPLYRYNKLKMDMEQRERERQALDDAKAIDGTVVQDDDERDYLADLGRRYHLKSLEHRQNSVHSPAKVETTGNGNGHARNGSGHATTLTCSLMRRTLNKAGGI